MLRLKPVKRLWQILLTGANILEHLVQYIRCHAWPEMMCGHAQLLSLKFCWEPQNLQEVHEVDQPDPEAMVLQALPISSMAC